MNLQIMFRLQLDPGKGKRTSTFLKSLENRQGHKEYYLLQPLNWIWSSRR